MLLLYRDKIIKIRYFARKNAENSISIIVRQLTRKRKNKKKKEKQKIRKIS